MTLSRTFTIPRKPIPGRNSGEETQDEGNLEPSRGAKAVHPEPDRSEMDIPFSSPRHRRDSLELLRERQNLPVLPARTQTLRRRDAAIALLLSNAPPAPAPIETGWFASTASGIHGSSDQGEAKAKSAAQNGHSLGSLEHLQEWYAQLPPPSSLSRRKFYAPDEPISPYPSASGYPTSAPVAPSAQTTARATTFRRTKPKSLTLSVLAARLAYSRSKPSSSTNPNEADEYEELYVDSLPSSSATRANELNIVDGLKRLHIGSPPSSQRECSCCTEWKHIRSFPLLPITASCTHESRTCVECMAHWIDSEIESKANEGIKCPECKQILSHDDVRVGASKDAFERYEEKLALSLLSSMEGFTWCLAKKCGSGQVNDEGASFMVCASCGFQQCLKHNGPWHTGETCKEYEYRTDGKQKRKEERATAKMIDSISKLCPGKTCGWRIEKNDGCDHMTCRKCHYEFCWICLADWNEIQRRGNTAHREDCKFHSNNL